MTISTDSLLDRMQLKAQANRWKALTVLAVLALLYVLISPTAKHSPIKTSHIARLNVEGVIYDDVARDELLEELKEDSSVKAVIVRLDTPGGTAVGGEELYLRLREIAAEKPVIAVMRSMATSAGYMTALGADRIYAREGTITGSIGVIIEAAEFTELAKKIGVTPITIKSAPLKGTPGMFEKSTPESERVLKDMIDDFYGFFVKIVAERRGLSPETTAKIADGRVYSGSQALSLKLVDAIGGEEEALAWLEQKYNLKNLDVQDATTTEEDGSFLDQFVGSVSRRILPGATALRPLDGLASIWHPAMHQ